MTIDTLLNSLWDIFKSVLPYLLTGLIAVWITHLRNRNERERLAISQISVARDAEKIRNDAQKLINTQFEKFAARTEQLASALAESQVQAAEEKGSLKQQILDLTNQLNVERRSAEGRSETNVREIAKLQAKIDLLVEQQGLLQAQVKTVVEEREALNRSLEGKIAELEDARQLLLQTQQKVEDLLTETSKLRDQIIAKDKELDDLRLRLGDPVS